MTDQIQSSSKVGSISPRERQIYEQEYMYGVQLFQKALRQYAKSANPAQKKDFQKMMDKAIGILNDAARELGQKHLLAQNIRIEQDYQDFNNNPTNAKIINKLEKNLMAAGAL